MDLEGSGGVRVGGLAFVADVGSVEIGTSLPAVAYEMTDWSEWGYTIFHVLAPEADTLNVLYLYCEASGFTWIWHEDYARAMDYEEAAGSCSHVLRTTVVADPGLRELAARPGAGELVTGFTIDGAEVGYASTGPGTIRMAGRIHDLYPFEVVDCTTECTEDPVDGWWELHSIMVDPEARACFGVLYLMVADTTLVQLGYPVCLDPLEHRDEEYLDADWSVDPTGGGGSVPDGPLPPGLGHRLRPLPPLLRNLEL
jgi:hypothetical protein